MQLSTIKDNLTMTKKAQHVISEAASEAIKGLIRAFGPKVFAIGLHNACAHGDIFAELGHDVSDESMDKLYEGIDTIKAAADLIIDE